MHLIGIGKFHNEHKPNRWTTVSMIQSTTSGPTYRPPNKYIRDACRMLFFFKRPFDTEMGISLQYIFIRLMSKLTENNIWKIPLKKCIVWKTITEREEQVVWSKGRVMSPEYMLSFLPISQWIVNSKIRYRPGASLCDWVSICICRQKNIEKYWWLRNSCSPFINWILKHTYHQDQS